MEKSHGWKPRRLDSHLGLSPLPSVASAHLSLSALLSNCSLPFFLSTSSSPLSSFLSTSFLPLLSPCPLPARSLGFYGARDLWLAGCCVILFQFLLLREATALEKALSTHATLDQAIQKVNALRLFQPKVPEVGGACLIAFSFPSCLLCSFLFNFAQTAAT